MAINKGLFTSNSKEWSTPQDFFDKLNGEFNFNLDPCATRENAKCENYFTKEDNGLEKKWYGRVFCNPPYGKEIKEWVKKAYIEKDNCGIIVMLLPARTDTNYFHNYIYNKAHIRFIKGRLKFGNSKNSAPFPSMIIIFNSTKSETNND